MTSHGWGCNIFDIIGIDGGYNTNAEVFAKVQLSPWAHISVSAGLEGLGVSIGLNSNNTSIDLSGKIGILPLIFAVFGIPVYKQYLQPAHAIAG